MQKTKNGCRCHGLKLQADSASAAPQHLCGRAVARARARPPALPGAPGLAPTPGQGARAQARWARAAHAASVWSGNVSWSVGNASGGAGACADAGAGVSALPGLALWPLGAPRSWAASPGCPAGPRSGGRGTPALYVAEAEAVLVALAQAGMDPARRGTDPHAGRGRDSTLAVPSRRKVRSSLVVGDHPA